jgi:sugar-specific transcriptional regulator TrmB
MKKLAALALSLFLISGTALADTPKDSDPQPAKSTQPIKANAAKPAEKTDSVFAAELEELRQALRAQQEELQLLKEELAKRDRQIDETRETAAAANARAAEASSKATEAVNTSAEVKSTEAALRTTVSNLTVSNAALSSNAAEPAQQTKPEEGPVAIRYKGITITPGGFVAAETASRTRATSSDINTNFTIPYPGNALTKVSENNFTARQSRVSLLAESKIDNVKLTGYWEADWLGTGVTSNNRQSNSYVLRQRIIFAQAAFDNGWSFTGGQQWSLATENRKGIQNRQEVIPLTIDSQYNVGFTWARQYGFRVVKDFGGKYAFGFSIEGPQATIGGRGFSLATTTNLSTAAVTTSGNTFLQAPGTGAGLLNFVDPLGSGTGGNTVNKAPDFIVKATADPGYGHYEVFGIISTFRNRVYPCGVVGTNAKDTVPPAKLVTLACPVDDSVKPSARGAFDSSQVGGGGGASMRLPLFAKKLDFGLKGVAGDGIGRYGSAQLSDLTFRPDGTEALIRTAHGIGELEYHPNAKLDLYAYFGAEYAWRAAYKGYNSISIITNSAVAGLGIPATTTTSFKLNQIGGYGSPFANNTGCSTENPPSNQLTPSAGGTCAGDTRVIYEGTLGFWHKFYQGPKGGLRWGIQYSYFDRIGWSGNNNTAVSLVPKAIDNVIMTSLRYYIP